MNDYVDWLKKNKITEVECMIPDNSGIPRGKILPTKKFLSSKQIEAVSIFVREVLQNKQLDKNYCEFFYEKGSKVCLNLKN